MIDPQVSIIAGCYNHGRYVEGLLNSVINQTYGNIQLIIFDDFSTDNSVEIIEKWISDNEISCVFLKHTENKGLSASLNEALAYATGTYFQLISCDDILVNTKIETQVNLFEKQFTEEYGCIASNFSTIDEQGKILSNYYFSKRFVFPENPLGAILTNDLGYGIIMHAPTLLYRRNILEKVGYFNEKIMQEDLDFLVRVCLHFKVAFCHQSLVKYRILQTSMSNNIKTLDRLYYERLSVIHNYESSLIRICPSEFYQHQLNYITKLLTGKIYDNVLEEKLSPFFEVFDKDKTFSYKLDNALIKTQTIAKLIELKNGNKFNKRISVKFIVYKKMLYNLVLVIGFVKKVIRKLLRETLNLARRFKK